jgi:hypothetical protein
MMWRRNKFLLLLCRYTPSFVVSTSAGTIWVLTRFVFFSEAFRAFYVQGEYRRYCTEQFKLEGLSPWTVKYSMTADRMASRIWSGEHLRDEAWTWPVKRSSIYLLLLCSIRAIIHDGHCRPYFGAKMRSSSSNSNPDCTIDVSISEYCQRLSTGSQWWIWPRALQREMAWSRVAFASFP